MRGFKRALLNSIGQLEARRWLYHLRDWRAFRPFLGETLFTASRTWPKLFPPRWKPRNIVDIGAHTGDISSQLAALYRPDFVCLVEPLPDMAPILDSLKLAPHQKYFPCALGREKGKAHLNILANAPSSSLLNPSQDLNAYYQRDMHIERTVEVEVRTLDEIMDECGISRIDLLKIDAEGYELEIFKGGLKTLPQTHIIVTEVVFFEAHTNRPLFGDVYKYLKDIDFELFGTFGFCYASNRRPLHCDAVFINLAGLTS